MRFIPLIVFILAIGCSQENKNVVVSLLGANFTEPQRTPEAQARLDSNLQVAKKNFEADPSEDNYIWYGRRTAYLMRLDDAIDIYTEGLKKYPESYRLLRHRGHRYISKRMFPEAIADLSKAEQLMAGKPLEVEPDGAPNKLNIPLSTTQFNVFYHLALAHYLMGDFAKAEETWEKCMVVCENDDSRVAVTDWLYMTFRRQNKTYEASELLGLVGDSLEIIENDSYDTRLKMYKGMLTPGQVLVVDPAAEDYNLSMATQGYGVGNWYYYNGDTAKALDVFNKVVSGREFAAFGFIAAEAELARLNKP
ncbi:MAG TPA: tetratricopeptide repeat protein [Cyclobacteriaceae bacterium]|nr:tetratricopeptide repeat protein [Cyclobacteriaceae bacterium]